IVCKTIKKLWLQIIILLLGSVVVLLFPNGTNNFFMYPYYIIGFYFAKYKDSIPKKLLSVKYSSLILFPFLMFFFRKEHLLVEETLFQSIEIDLFRWFIGLIGSLCVIVLMQLLYDFIIRKNDKFFVWKATAYLGEKSLQIYALSVIFLSSYLPKLYSLIINLLPSIDTFFAQYIWVYNLGFTVVLAILYCIGISIIIKLLEKTKISPILFGK
ncbi:MAG: hypothetical protein IJV80_05740, partial [Clostridia bacterium]|nr:hypothetical protein [Clostridia bacterium]